MKLPNPLTTLLQDATNRFHADTVWLGDRLKQDPALTLFVLSTKPTQFGAVKAFTNPRMRASTLRNLLECARAYANMEQKHAADGSRQGELPLTESQAVE